MELEDPANAPVELEGLTIYTELAAGEGDKDGTNTPPTRALPARGGGVAVGVGGFIIGRGIDKVGPGPDVDWRGIAGAWGELVGPGAGGGRLLAC